MTRRHQLILFVLGLVTVSICTVAFALAMNLGRSMTITASTADRLPAIEAEAGAGLAWQMPTTPVSSSSTVSVGQSSPASVPDGPEGEPMLPAMLTSTATHAQIPTNTRVPTWTPSPTDTATATRIPTDTPVPTPTDTPPPPPPSQQFAPEPQPAAAPQPAAPTPTPAPEFPYDVGSEVFDTGTPQMTRVTGMVWRIINVSPAQYDGDAGYQMRLVDPNGNVHLSDVSGIGGTDSTCRDCGDNRRMNMKIEFLPYVPGTYRVTLVRGEEQMSSEAEFALAAGPQQYVHVNFFPLQ